MSDEMALIRHLAQMIAERVIATDRDGLPNSKAHLDRIDECARAIHAIASGEEPVLPI